MNADETKQILAQLAMQRADLDAERRRREKVGENVRDILARIGELGARMEKLNEERKR